MKTRKITTETILKTTDFEVINYRGIDPDTCFAYEVYDADNDLVHECDDRGEALDYAKDEQEAIDAEKAEDRLNSLKDQAIELITDCEDEETVKKVLAMLKRAK
jgi:nitrogen regulatory protein PII-like uncharacterized protein